MERLDFIHSIQMFKDVESAMHEYFLVYGKRLDPIPRPTISQFYTLSEEQKDREIIFIMFGLTAVAIYSYTITKHKP